MMYHRRLIGQVLTACQHQLRLIVKGISGADRREKQRLMRKLSALKAEYNLLNHQKEAVRHQLSLENRALQTLYDEVKAERDDLQLEVWELEDLVEELFELLTSVEAWQSTVESAVTLGQAPGTENLANLQSLDHQKNDSATSIPVTLAAVDLGNIKLALVGGHDSTRRGVIRELSEHYGLVKWVELPPFSKHSMGRSNIKAKIHDCDLIVLITGYMQHKQTNSIVQLRKLKSLSGDVLLLNCRGKSGVVREILTYISQKNC